MTVGIRFLVCFERVSKTTNTRRVFHVASTWKRRFPRRCNVEDTWYACRGGPYKKRDLIDLGKIMSVLQQFNSFMTDFPII